jgi:DNA-binding response OmpR family regulator
MPLDDVEETDALPCLLIEEDDELVGEIVGEMLEGHYDIHQTDTAQKAITKLTTLPIEVVFLDYQLPGGNGDLVAAFADKRTIPLVWMTGNMNRLVEVRARSSKSHSILMLSSRPSAR